MTKDIKITIGCDETGYDVLVNNQFVIGFDHPAPEVHSKELVSLLKVAYEAGKEGLVMTFEEVKL